MSQEDANTSKQSVNYQVLIPQEYFSGHKNDEISLYDMWDVLVRRKWVIVSTITVFIILMLFYVFTATPVYKATASLLIGNIGISNSYKRVEDSKVILSSYSGKYGVSISDKETILQKGERGVKGSMLLLQKTGSDPKNLFESVSKLTNEIYEALIKRYDSLISEQNRLVAQTSNEMKVIDLHLKELAILRKRVKGGMLVEILKETRELQTRKTELQEVLLNLAFARQLNTKTIISKKPTEPKSPIKPRKKLLLILSIVLGGFIGIILAFVMELFHKAKGSRKPA